MDRRVRIVGIVLTAALWGAGAGVAAGPEEAVDGGILGKRPPKESLRGASASPISGSRVLAMVLGLGGILALVVGGAWVLRRAVPGIAPAASKGLVEILGRTPVGPKQAVVLVRAGPRVVLLGLSADRMEKLSEFQDPAEVERLAFRTPLAAGSSASFGTMLRGMVAGFRPRGLGEFEPEDAMEARVRREIDSLRRKLAAWDEGGGEKTPERPGEGERTPASEGR